MTKTFKKARKCKRSFKSIVLNPFRLHGILAFLDTVEGISIAHQSMVEGEDVIQFEERQQEHGLNDFCADSFQCDFEGLPDV